jgi:parallel beta-helix repeat protein
MNKKLKYLLVVFFFSAYIFSIAILYIIKNPSLGAIDIQNNRDFKKYDFPGSGTQSDPYILENLNISTTMDYAIFITSTSKYFIIRNCHLSALRTGIFISNIAPNTASVVHNVCIDNNLFGIYIELSSGVTLYNNTCSSNNIGIHLYSSSNVVLSNNSYISNNFVNLDIYYSSSITIINNTCKKSYYGIYLRYSSNITLTNNTFSICGLKIDYSDLSSLYSLVIEDNIINNKKLGFFVNISNFIISNPLYGQLFLINCSNFVITNQILSNTNSGLQISHCSNLTVVNNSCFNNNEYGISIEYSKNISLVNNTCNKNEHGIKISYSSYTYLVNNFCCNNSNGIFIFSLTNYVFIANNICNDNNWSGVRLGDMFYCSIINNTCNSNEFGFSLYNIEFSTITNNTFNGNYEYGLKIYQIKHCLIRFNTFTMISDYAIYFDSGSYFNYIFHNNFFTIYSEGTSQAYDDAVNNFWYNETISEGNYWSDWSGVGYYEIDGASGATDLYPLTNPFTII